MLTPKTFLILVWFWNARDVQSKTGLLKQNGVPKDMTSLMYLAFLLFFSCHSMIFHLPTQKLSDNTSARQMYPEILKRGWAMYSLADTPAGDKDPYVSLSVVVKRLTDNDAHGFLMMGNAASVVNLNCVSKPSPTLTLALKEFSLSKSENATQTVSLMLPINVTDLYYMGVMSCSPAGFELESGEAVWFNPYGYLPGNIYKKLPVSAALAFLYLAVAIGYMVSMILRRKILLNIQYGIFAVLVVGVLEVSSWYFYRLERNTTGEASHGGLVTVVLIANIKRTATRVLLLLMAMGVGVVKWTVGNVKVRIALLAVSYLCFAFLAEMMTEMEAISIKAEAFARWVRFCIVVPQSMLDTCFYYWIILSIVRTIQQLTLRRQTLKLDMYKWFFGVLAIAGLLSLIFAGYLMVVKLVASLASWQSEWIQDMFWEFLFFVVMSAIAILWRPRANNTRYGYAEFFQKPDQNEPPKNEEASEILEISSELTHRKRGQTSEEKPQEEEETLDDQRERTAAALNQSNLFTATEYFSVFGEGEDQEIMEDELKKVD